MSLQFIAGPAGCGKSFQVCRQMIEEAVREPEKQFLVIVPEQFTMQTQKEILEMHPKKGLLNIDVLSFNRLAWRVFEEVGGNRLPVLEDTGKNLVVRHVIMNGRGRLKIMQGSLEKQGASAEMSSLISELLQYRISPEDLDDWAEAQRGGRHERLALKLEDVKTVYTSFLSYLQDHYLTTEEVPELLCSVIDRSALIRGSVIVMDGFTGFTPVQEQVVSKLLKLADSVRVVVTCGSPEELRYGKNLHSLFHMSREMTDRTTVLAREAGTEILPAVWLAPSGKSRFAHSPALSYMEENLFRYGERKPYGKPQTEIAVLEAQDPVSEMRAAAEQIRRMVREEGYRWRDFAVVTGDLDTYGRAGTRIFQEAGIPYFLDQKKSVLDNPAVEFIRSAIDMEIRQYSYESVFRFLRSGMTDFSGQEADDMETYVRALGVRGWKKYDEEWTRMPKSGPGGADAEDERAEPAILGYNRLREKFTGEMREFHEAFHGRQMTAEDRTKVLYGLIVRHRLQDRLEEMSDRFSGAGNAAGAKEYSQLYRAIMDLLNRIAVVLGDERMSMKEYQQILDAGFEEIAIGVIPPGEDQVMIGDIERTRLRKIRVLFFTGINDGLIPKPSVQKGILSEPDRSRLEEGGARLSPSAREKMFRERFYLYLAMTKPSDRLYLSYARTSADGSAAKPAGLIHVIRRLFAFSEKLEDLLPVLTEEELYRQDLTRLFETPSGERAYLLKIMQAIPASEVPEEAETILRRIRRDPHRRVRAERLLEAKTAGCRASAIGNALAEKLYGTDIELSVTRLEEFAGCPYRHFLDYGLRLQEREDFEFRLRDFGNVMHRALQIFSAEVAERGLSWRSLTDSQRNGLADLALRSAAGNYGNAVLMSSGRNRYEIEQLSEMLRRTVWALQKQIMKGAFEPDRFEFRFGGGTDTSSFAAGHAVMNLYGRIDRLDVCDADGVRYLKIIDYKTGSRDLDLNRVYSGLQLQLPLYMREVCEEQQRQLPSMTAEPAGIFYYHIQDPLVDEADADARDEEILKALRPLGLVRSEKPVQRLFDAETEDGQTSDVLPAGVKIGDAEKADRSEKKKPAKAARGREDFYTLLDFAGEKARELGEEMMRGNCAISPALQFQGSKETDECTYCEGCDICAYDERLEGYRHRLVRNETPDDVIRHMQSTLAGQDGEQAAGDEAGQTAHESDGYEAGQAAGDQSGQKTAEAAGYEAGQATGDQSGQKAAEAAGYEAGQATGDQSGRKAAEAAGDEAGQAREGGRP